jgi:hypothetical protein
LHKNADMRTTLDFPDELFRHLKTRAAIEGTTLRELVMALVERGLDAPAEPAAKASAARLPSVSLGAPMALRAKDLSNARLADMLDE